MRCTSYCTANSYEMQRLFQALLTSGTPHLYRDVIHLEIKEDKASKGDIFYFPYGCVVLWGLEEQEEMLVLDRLKQFEKEPNSRIERDDFTFAYGEIMKIDEDEIVIQNKNSLTKLSISHGIAQSVKLAIFEETVNKTIDHTKFLPNELAMKGKITLSRRQISQKMGELFIERNIINLNSEILDTPEFFWEFPELEPFYRKTAHYLDVTKRVEVMNKRLNVIHELFEILSSELNHQHSSRLEWIIIILIGIEILIVLLKDFFHII